MVSLRFVLLATLAFPPGFAQAHEFSGPLGTVEVDWEASNISRITSSGYSDVFGIEVSMKSGFPELETVDGRDCVTGSIFVFDVADDFAYDIDETVTIDLTFDRRETTGFWISYDRNALAEPVQEIHFEESVDRWQTHSVTLERARFANRGARRQRGTPRRTTRDRDGQSIGLPFNGFHWSR